MTRITIKPEQLDQLASGIQDAERKADEAISDFKWNYQSLLMNITGANTGKIDALQAELQYEMRKYRDKLHDLQAAVKLTERKMTEEDDSLSAKFGLMALKFSGLNRLFQDYDPVTGEALSWSERLFGKNPLNASYGGAFGEVFPDLQHALNPQVIQSRMKQTYESVVLDPLSKTTTYLDDVRQDVSHSVVRYSSYVDRWWGETRQKIDEVRNTTWDFMGDVVEGVLDGSGNAVKDTFEGIFNEGFIETIRRLNPVYSVTKDVPKLISLSKSVYEDPKGSFQKVVDVPKYMWQGVKEAWDRDVVNGDAASRTEFFTYGLTTIGIGLLGDKGLSKVGTAAKTIDKVSDAAKRVKIEGNGPQPALAGVSAGAFSKGGTPYNVLHVPISRIKTEIDRVYGGKGTVSNVQSTTRIHEVRVNFKRNVKHDSEEFARQLKDQEKGMNELTMEEYLKNRERYIAEGRALESNAIQQTAREEAFFDKVSELITNGKSIGEAEEEAKRWLSSQAALHNPDQIAGGKPDKIGGMGDRSINSSIGSQWRYRIDVIDEQIVEKAKNMTPEQLKNTYLNVKLTH
ncbi:polymorphic toxin type 15 domain-containing protein [Guptibacillus sedimenti]|uniref:polymorphic toxin type 15 domain-containing protein n=1 Tax=Guptibacillus sedimenti TaxID=3025680 RepID=UPI002360D780|nr:polymorphic toxin type 15 domain-containing protein [Pseudalkalibacillus sedimenti]